MEDGLGQEIEDSVFACRPPSLTVRLVLLQCLLRPQLRETNEDLSMLPCLQGFWGALRQYVTRLRS